uniref:Ficolin-2-like n=1 Tax=Crassostrea virginica TaxID=6565 RepID=A0A8B8CFL5_CRAVI|nr:ficolin-2-like [Crassostrea virginica]
MHMVHVPFKVSLLFLLLSVPDLGRCQFHGHFNFIGFVDYPYPEVTNQIIVTSRLKCSSICLENKDCYYYDYCEAESSTSCFLHDQHVNASILVTAGACKRYKLKQSCDIEYTNPCRCPANFGAERCKYKYDCDGNLVDWDTPSYQFTRSFPNNVGRDLLCEMGVDNGGWIVIQRRVDGSTDFYKNWNDYENGFGDLATNFYLGNYYIHEIVKTQDYELRIDLRDQAGNWAFAGYRNFFIGGPGTSYTLDESEYYGNAGDSLAVQNGMKFTTYDRDNDMSPSNCAVSFKGAWWHRSCHYSNLNGLYGMNTSKGIIWFHWKGYNYSLKQTKMMVRKKIRHQL